MNCLYWAFRVLKFDTRKETVTLINDPEQMVLTKSQFSAVRDQRFSRYCGQRNRFYQKSYPNQHYKVITPDPTLTLTGAHNYRIYV